MVNAPLLSIVFFRKFLWLNLLGLGLLLTAHVLLHGADQVLCEWGLAGVVAAAATFLGTRCVVLPSLPGWARRRPSAWVSTFVKRLAVPLLLLPLELTLFALWGVVMLPQPLPKLGWVLVGLMANVGIAWEALARLSDE